MTKQELMETYTAEQLAEMVLDLQNIPTAGKINCEDSGNSDLIKVKCDKCGEEFLAFLDEKYILCKKTELFGTQDANEQLKKDVEKLQSEVEKYRKAFEDAKKERDYQIAEYQKKIEELEEYANSLKCSIRRKQDAINQINGIICELFGITHSGEIYTDDFKELLREMSEVGKTIANFLPAEPIRVADMLINASKKRTNCMTGKEYDKYIFEKWQLRQIAEHLLVYCNHNGEVEE